MPKDIQQFFKYGLDRDIPPLAQPPARPGSDFTGTAQKLRFTSLELGPGKKKHIPSDFKLGRPEWEAGLMMPFPAECMGEIHAYQFFEHLDGDTALAVLRECERVLVPGGVLNMVTPYYSSAHQAQALDHKSFWSEETWHWMFGNQYYDPLATWLR